MKELMEGVLGVLQTPHYLVQLVEWVSKAIVIVVVCGTMKRIAMAHIDATITAAKLGRDERDSRRRESVENWDETGIRERRR